MRKKRREEMKKDEQKSKEERRGEKWERKDDPKRYLWSEITLWVPSTSFTRNSPSVPQPPYLLTQEIYCKLLVICVRSGRFHHESMIHGSVTG